MRLFQEIGRLAVSGSNGSVTSNSGHSGFERPAAALDRLQQFFPGGTRVRMTVRIARLPLDSTEPIDASMEYATAREVILRSALPLEFGDSIRLENRDGSFSGEARVLAVQIGTRETWVAARFTTHIPNWIIQS